MPRNEEESSISPKKVVAIILVVIIAIVGVLVIVSAYQTVPAGYEGVVLQWGNPVNIVGPGLQLITPFAQSITLVNTQVQTATATESASSSDLQQVTTSVTVNYQLDANNAIQIYTTLRNTYQNSIIIPAMQDALKATTATFQASELVTNREQVRSNYETLLQTKLAAYHITVLSISITNFAFSDTYQSAIDAKTTAQQNALAANNTLQIIQYQAQQQIIQATANATAVILQAEGKANATIIAANATAQATELISSQLNPSYIQYLYALGWNGQLPIYWVSGNGTAPYLLVTVPDNSTTPTTPSNGINTVVSNQIGNGVQQTLTVTENATATSVGDTIAITAQLSSNQAGVTVIFYNNNSQIGTAITNNNGQATYNFARVDNSNYVFSAKTGT